MEINEIKRLFDDPNTKFYGRIYGDVIPATEIVEIKKEKLGITASRDAFYYIWGWPGPDVTFYKFENYGKSWAFRMEDFK